MAKPKGPTNSKTGKKFPAESSIEITEKQVPSSLDLQLQQLKLDKESKTEKTKKAEQELFNSSEQETQLEDGIAWMAKRLARDRELKDKKEKKKKKKNLKLLRWVLKLELKNIFPN